MLCFQLTRGALISLARPRHEQHLHSTPWCHRTFADIRPARAGRVVGRGPAVVPARSRRAGASGGQRRRSGRPRVRRQPLAVHMPSASSDASLPLHTDIRRRRRPARVLQPQHVERVQQPRLQVRASPRDDEHQLLLLLQGDLGRCLTCELLQQHRRLRLQGPRKALPQLQHEHLRRLLQLVQHADDLSSLTRANPAQFARIRGRSDADVVAQLGQQRTVLRVRAASRHLKQRQLHAAHDRQRHVLIDRVQQRHPRPLLQGARQEVHHVQQEHLRVLVIVVVDGVRRTSTAVEVEPEPVQRRLHFDLVQQLPVRQ